RRGMEDCETNDMKSNRRDAALSSEGNGWAELDELGLPSTSTVASSLRRAIVQTREWLLGQQHADGYWVGELEGDTILESEYILLLAYLGRENSERAHKTSRYLLNQQLPTGGWAIYPGGPLEISASIKAYLALKLTGHSAYA